MSDYRHFGAGEDLPRQVIDIRNQLPDWTPIVAYARSLAEDADRIALWGSPFGGGHVVRTTAGDRRVRAVLAQAPYLGMSGENRPPARTTLSRTGRSLSDPRCRLNRRAAPLLISLFGAPDTDATFQGPGGEAMFRSPLQERTTWINALAARIVVQTPACRPGRFAGRVRCPVSYRACTRDSITPESLLSKAVA